MKQSISFVPKIIMLPVGTIKAAPFNPKARSEDGKRLRGLTEAIKELGGIVYPLIVSADNRLIDGHRRLAAAKRLGMKEVPVIVLPLELQRAWILLNETQWKNTGRAYTEIVYNGVSIENLPPATRRLFEDISRLIGDEGIAEMATKQPPMAPHVLSIARSVGRYLGDQTDAAMSAILLWLIRCDMQNMVRWAMNSHIPVNELWKAIRSNRPLSYRAEE